MAFLVGFGLGLFVGWIALRRPQWATDAIAWVKGKVTASWGS